MLNREKIITEMKELLKDYDEAIKELAMKLYPYDLSRRINFLVKYDETVDVYFDDNGIRDKYREEGQEFPEPENNELIFMLNEEEYIDFKYFFKDYIQEIIDYKTRLEMEDEI